MPPKISLDISSSGILKERVNRFLAKVQTSFGLVYCHVPNPGRMEELLYPGCQVMLRNVDGKLRKTNYDLVLAFDGNVPVSIDSRLPNALVQKALEESYIPEFVSYEFLRREIPFGNSRFDFLLRNGRDCLLEVKSCTLVENGQALFPDAPTKRGTRHLRHLEQAASNGYKSYLLFVIQRSDASSFKPNSEMDPDFTDALYSAASSGVIVQAYNCQVNRRSVTLQETVKLEPGLRKKD